MEPVYTNQQKTEVRKSFSFEQEEMSKLISSAKNLFSDPNSPQKISIEDKKHQHIGEHLN